MDKLSFFKVKKFSKNLLLVNFVGKSIWRSNRRHVQIVLIPIVCIFGIFFNKFKLTDQIPIIGIFFFLLLLYFGVYWYLKSKSKISLNNSTYVKNAELLKEVYFIYVLIYYLISTFIFLLIYFLC